VDWLDETTSLGSSQLVPRRRPPTALPQAIWPPINLHQFRGCLQTSMSLSAQTASENSAAHTQIGRDHRIFSPNTIIDRSCGKDPTGTLYLGLAGSGRKNWSILRNRINSIVKQKHHVFNHYQASELVRQKFPWASLSVEWAFTGKILDHKGDPEAEAMRAERFLLNSYNDSFGEYPPWNIRV
jgi:hypothetical protein